ncbi:efflux RND transporter permease subunit [Candidatus Parabeggiatoa sp. HSG14]|uniref:efflux RND transporter permease subunit n=1 Tax=Candidatus Parabeggiatoa sp. HSG14 TaxID=3055593 RepID=UPI0025A71BF5|nr:efflux RND transporter permease subunit [Thiotrichales bacterium HSG14]
MTDQYSSMEKTPQHLGLAGKMAQSFIHSPLSPLFFFAMLFMGILGLTFTPRQEDPQISVPMVDIFVQYPGASVQQVASLTIDPLQRIMSEIPDVKHVYSAAERGQGMVTVQFEVGEELEHSILKVHDKLQSNMDKIPPGVMPPLVKPKGIDDVPVVALTLWSENLDDGYLRTLALDVMQSLKGIPNTGQSFIVGGRTEQVLVEVRPEVLSGFGISIGQVAQTIQTANSKTSAGQIEAGNTHFTVYTGKFLSSAEDIKRLVVGTYQGAPVYVRDVAKVTQGAEKEPYQMVNYFSGLAYEKHDAFWLSQEKSVSEVNGAPAVTVAVSKKIGTNGVDVARDILTHVDTLRKNHVIPDNVYVEVTRNYGQTANDKVNGLIKKLFIATGAVTLLVFYFLGWRPSLVVTLVIPVVILVTVFSAWILGYTIDRVSLFALIFSIGILVDDAIVVIENIYRRWLFQGETDTQTAVDAVREVGNPTILATFTVVAALLPMGFVSGMMGPYMGPIPALGSVAMIFSLFAAFVFTPWLAMRFKPSLAALQKAELKEHKKNERWEKFFRKILPPLFTSRILGWGFLVLLIFSFFAACSMFYFQSVEVKMLPLDKKPEFNVFIDMPEGTALPVTANLTYQLAEKLRFPAKFPEVIALQTYVGTSQPFDFNGMVRHYYLRHKPWHADIHVQLEKKKCGFDLSGEHAFWKFSTLQCYFEHNRSSHEIAVAARIELKKLLKELNSPAKITVVEMPPGPPVLQSIVAEIYGPDDKTRREVATKMTQVFEEATILNDVDNYMPLPHKAWRFEVDTEKAVRRGISVDTINRNLTMALGGFKLGDIKQGNMLEPTYIVIQVPLTERSQLSRLYDLPIPTQTGSIVPLTELGRFVQEEQDTIYYQKDLRPVEYVVGDAVGVYDKESNEYSLSAPIYGMLEIESLLKDYETPDGINLVNTGCTDLYVISFCDRYIGPPKAIGQSGLEWTGEWTVTYETFRDMGLAFGVAMILIYVLVVWLFGNFTVPAIIMAPIPLTLLGIIPGHALLDAEFTATSMIGWIALAGIIVRNSILLVDYSIHEIQRGTSIQDAVILACKTRTRPILITAFALVAGSFVILFDPIFQGMAISLLFGVLVSTLLTLVVIPLGCISIGPEALCANTGKTHSSTAPIIESPAMPLWLRLWIMLITLITVIVKVITTIIDVVKMAFYIIRAIFILIFTAIGNLWRKITAEIPPNGAIREETPSSNQAPTVTPTTSTEPKVEIPSKPTIEKVSIPETVTPPPSSETKSSSDEQATPVSREKAESPEVETVDSPPVPSTTKAVTPTVTKDTTSSPVLSTEEQQVPTAKVEETAPSPEIPPSTPAVSSEPRAETSEQPQVSGDTTSQVQQASSVEKLSEGSPTTKPTTSRASKRKTTSRRGIQLKADLVTQYKQERGDQDEGDKPGGDEHKTKP